LLLVHFCNGLTNFDVCGGKKKKMMVYDLLC
jgi:hypothetical protein